MEACGARCWYARDNTCHCICNGSMHGFARDNIKLPPRMIRVKKDYYQLREVFSGSVQGYIDSRNRLYKEMDEARKNGLLRSYDAVLIRTASESQSKNWPEFSAVFDGKDRPYGLWFRMTKEELEAISKREDTECIQ